MDVSACACTCAHAHGCVHGYVHVHIGVYVCLHMCGNVCVCVRACVLFCTCVCTCACACLLVCTYVRGHVYACICLQSHWIDVYRCASMHVFVYMHVQAGADDYIYLYAHMFTHACINVFIHICFYLRTPGLPYPPPSLVYTRVIACT